jgi:hypothetical protein
MLKSRYVEKELHKENNLFVLMVFPVAFLLFGLFMNFFIEAKAVSLLEGFMNILLSPTILITDFIEVGGIGAAFINAALIGFFNLYLLKKYKMRINGLLIAAFMTLLGFSFFGKNVLNIIPLYVGGYMYVRYQRRKMKDVILIIMFSTALSPLVSEMIFGGILPDVLALPVGIGIGIVIGFIIVPLSSHMLRFHDGFNLYNIGFTAGIIGTVFTSILRSFNVEIEPVSILYDQSNDILTTMMLFLFLYLVIVGLYINRHSGLDYLNILKYRGRTVTDFTYLVGYGVTYFNMGIMGLMSLGYVSIVGGVINGPVIAGIFTVVGFAAFGKHPKNCLPIVLGVILAAVILGNDLSSTGMIITVLFSTTIAPIAGTYGLMIGILGGALHMMIVTNIGIVHGGINLYNNGFSGGLVAGFLVPIIDAFKKGDE